MPYTDRLELQAPQQATGELGGRSVTYQPQRHQVQAKQVRPSFTDSALSGLAALGQKYASLRMESEMERAYVDGQTQHKAGVIEDELDANWFTRPFVRGGWRDQQYLANLADDFRKESQFIAEHGKKQNSEDYIKGRQERIANFLQSAEIQGASARVRGKAISMLMQQDEQLGKMYAKEHSEWSAHVASQADHAAVLTFVNSLPADIDVQMGADISSQLGLFYEYLHSGVEKHGEITQHQIRANLLTMLYKQGHVSAADALYGMMLEDGKLADMPLQVAQELSANRQGARQKAGLQYKPQALEMLIQVEQMLDSGGYIPPEFARSTLEQLVRSDALDSLSDRQVALMHVAAKRTDKEDERLLMAEAWFSGNKDLQTEKAWDEEKMTDAAWDAAQRSTGDLREATEKYLRAMLTHKWAVPSKAFSKSYERAVRSYMQADEKGVAHAQTLGILEQTTATLAAAEGFERDAFVTNLVSQAEPEIQAVMLHTLYNKGSDFDVNMNQAAAILANNEEGKSRNAYIAAREVRDFEKVGEFLESEYWTGWHKLKSKLGIFGAHMSGDAQTFTEFKQRVAAHVPVVQTRPGMSTVGIEHVMRLAAEEIADRYVSWHPKEGRVASVFLPEGFREDLANVTNPEGNPILGGVRVGDEDLIHAMQQLYDNPNKGDAVRFDTAADGSIQAYIYDRKNQAVVETGAKVDIAQVAAKIRENQQKHVDKIIGANTSAGSAKSVDTQDPVFGTVKVGVNGLNSLNLDKGLVQQWRSELIDAEGFRTKAYKDSEGNWTVGVGRNLDANPLTDKRMQWAVKNVGSMHPQMAMRLFQEDSNRALVSAASIAQDYGFEADTHTVLAVADAVFQLGAGNTNKGMRSFQTTLARLADGGDFEEYAAGLRNTKWFKQTPKRVEAFIRRTKPRFDNARKPPVEKHYGEL